jgi:8-oxo-dGTP diphosphatase
MKAIAARIWKVLHLPKQFQIFLMRLFQSQFLVGVTGVIFNQNNEILLFKHTYRQHEWSLPGGYIKAGEHPAEALEREIFEESQLVVSADNVLFTRTDRKGARLDISYSGIFIGGEFKPGHEVSEYGFFAPDRMPLLRSNQVILIDDAIQKMAVKN